MMTSTKIVLAAAFALVFFVSTDTALAGNLTGYAWSSNIGWISVDCNNHGGCGASNYGLNVTPSGAMEGYAWSPYLGWITFNQGELSGCPTAPCEARFTKAVGETSGWARSCGVFVAGCAGALKPANLRGGWEGWIHLRGGSGSTAYGINATGPDWGGYAWGGGTNAAQNDAVIGWLSFSGPGYGVEATGPNANDATGTGPQVSCGVTPGATAPTRPVSWNVVTYGITGTSYQWNFTGTGVSLPNPATVNTTSITKVYGASGQKSASVIVNPGPSQAPSGPCSGVAISGNDPGFAEVQIGNYNVIGNEPDPIGSVLEGDSVVIRGDVEAIEINPGPLTVPFTSEFEIALDCGACGPATTPDISLPSTVIPAINEGDRIQVIATWPSALYGTTGNHAVRLCSDDQDVIAEYNFLGLSRENNCSEWIPFSVFLTPPPPITASCSVEPSLITEGGSARWTVTAAGGNGSFTYSWSGTDGLSGNGTSVTKTYGTLGTKSAQITITSPGAPNSPATVTCATTLRVRSVEEF